MSQQRVSERLKAALDTFRSMLDHPRLAALQPNYASTTASDLYTFLRKQDENRNPSLDITAKVSPIKTIFDLTYNARCNSNAAEEGAFRQLYGCLQCTLLAGHNVYKDMPKLVDLLEQTGWTIKLHVIGQIQEPTSEHWWECVCLISEEITRLCTSYISQGLSLAEEHAHSMTWDQIREAQNGYRISQSQVLLQSHISNDKLDKINQWLSPPDPSSDYYAALEERQAGTGSWFLASNQFARWKTTNGSILWLYGKPGCGKTILASTAIENITLHIRTRLNQAVVYFYFTFRDSQKQGPQNLLLSVVQQLYSQSKTSTRELDELFYACENGRRSPSIAELMKVLPPLIKSFNETFFVFDALDECEETGRKGREKTLQCVSQILGWRLDTLHIIITSRPEKDIEDFIQPSLRSNNRICIQSALVNEDICSYIRERLRNDSQFSRWRKHPKVQREIESNLMGSVDGMFRWAQCQLDAIGSCVNLPSLRKALASLPADLDETYARILHRIKPEYRPYAITILQWLVFSARPLRIKEVVEVLAIEMDPEPRFDPEARLPEPRDILAICSSLVTIVPVTLDDEENSEIEEIALAHFSVKEYLVSGRVINAPGFEFDTQTAEARISEACLIYLLHFQDSSLLGPNILRDFPLATYAAEYWTRHTRAAATDADRVNLFSVQLFQSKTDAFINWIRLFDPDEPWRGIGISRNESHIATPLYYASLEGLSVPVTFLLHNGANVNAQGGHYGTALQAASAGGYDKIVQVLLDKDADVNAQGGVYGTALQAASAGGHDKIVQMLRGEGTLLI